MITSEIKPVKGLELDLLVPIVKPLREFTPVFVAASALEALLTKACELALLK